MMRRCSTSRGIAAILTGAAFAVSLAGCSQTLVRSEAERIAKDWSYVIRASQVMPVYPLVEDLQPGDVFLVDVPLNVQAETWDRKGYLPLDSHFARLGHLDPLYTAFYADGYWRGDLAAVPHARPQPATTATSGPSTRRFSGAEAPLAAFPTYSFNVSRSTALSVALPVQGVPIALGLSGASQAVASITIGDALAYGLPIDVLVQRLMAWATTPANRALLRLIADQATARGGDPAYLRIVTRVYFVGAVNVTLNTEDGAGAQGETGGAVGNAGTPDLTQQGTAQVYLENLTALSNAVSNALPGGAIRFGYIRQGSISLAEEFPRPLAIGYLGFDVPILPGGQLGPPTTTRALVSGEVSVAAPVSQLTDAELNYHLRAEYLRAMASGTSVQQARAVEAVIGASAALSFLPQMSAMQPAPNQSSLQFVDEFLALTDAIVTADGGDPYAFSVVVAAIDEQIR